MRNFDCIKDLGPDDLYMGAKPAIDSLGQSSLLEYSGKVHSLEELKAE